MTREQLQALLALQKKDLTLLQLKKESQTIPARQDVIRSRADAARSAEKAAKEAIQACEAEIKEDELEVESVRSQVAKYKTQQMEAKSNEEYKAFNHEIAAAEEKIGQAEDRELEHMSRLEELKEGHAGAVQEREEAEAQVDAEVGDLEERLAVIKSTFGEVKEERTVLAERVPKDVLDQYMGQLGKKQDAVVVPVKQKNCGGCHMELTPQTLHDAHSSQKWTTCGFCGRYLYDPSAV